MNHHSSNGPSDFYCTISIVTAIFLLLFGSLYSEPVLEPPTKYVCPNVTITYTCQASDINNMEWSAKPHFLGNRKISYGVGIGLDNTTSHYRPSFCSMVIYVVEDVNIQLFLNITTTLTAFSVTKPTIITCSIYKIGQTLPPSSTSLLKIADVPSWRTADISYHEYKDYFTAVLELGEMFDGGGVPIDHYIIQLDNGTQLETTNSTYSFDIMYNTTLSVNISAHNCAGYTPFFPLMIQPVTDKKDHSIQRNTSPQPTVIQPTVIQPTVIQTPTLNRKSITTLTIGLIILGIFSFFVSATACILFSAYLTMKCYKERVMMSKVDIEENTAYGVTVSGPDYNMENNPLYEMRDSEERCHQVQEQPPIYETIDI